MSHLNDLKAGFRQIAATFVTLRNPMWERMEQARRDRIDQCLRNNLYDNNPGELDRWSDDGGR